MARRWRQRRLDYSSIGRIACSTVGPGSFTGVRVGLATARGIALGLNVPVVGIGALEASCAQARHILSGSSGASDKPDILALLDAKRGEVFAQFFAARQSGTAKEGSIQAKPELPQASRWWHRRRKLPPHSRASPSFAGRSGRRQEAGDAGGSFTSSP
ncbi:MAG: tRNA (adenosine(37)-N6)-threonylcarbamoyltransferase complex dimerization subunit type 1 TsaB [Nitratireductor sp.]